MPPLNKRPFLKPPRLSYAIRVLREERGSVESALTLIPLMLLFLTVFQVCLSVYTRNTFGETTQGAVAYAAMGAASPTADLAGPAWKSSPIAMPLPGGGSVLVGEQQIHNTSVTPLLPGGDSFTTTGIAIQE